MRLYIISNTTRKTKTKNPTGERLGQGPIAVNIITEVRSQKKTAGKWGGRIELKQKKMVNFRARFSVRVFVYSIDG
jgi:hypothetical protein